MPDKLFIDNDKAETIHNASLRVLANTGMKIEHEEAVDTFLAAGATRDDDGRILISEKMVNEALEKAVAGGPPKLYSRDGEKMLELKSRKSYFGPGSDALYNIDIKRGEKRKSKLSDLVRNVTIADALPGFDFIMSMALPNEVDKKKLYATVFAEMVKHTTKPMVVTSTSQEDINQIFDIASIVAGGPAAFQEKPFFLAYLEPISPLIMDNTSTDRLLFCAEKGIPILYAAGANCGSGAPITPEGGVVQGGAESLAGLVLATLKNEHVSFVYGANTSAMDMRSTIVSYGDPIWFKTVAMYSDMGKYYGLPSWGTAGSSDSFKVDAQAAMEAYEGISLALMSETALSHDVGYLAHGELYDARMLVLTDMMIGRARHVLKEIDLSDEALAVEVIDEVARSGELYISHEHTGRNFKKALWIPPKYINRRYISDIEGEEFEDLLSREVHDILEKHKPPTLPEEVEIRVDSYLYNIR